MRATLAFVAIFFVVVALSLEVDHAPLPNEVLSEKNPFERFLSPREREKLRLAADLTALHAKIHELQQSLPAPIKMPDNYRPGVKAENIHYLPMDPEGSGVRRASFSQVFEKLQAQTRQDQ